MDQVRVLDIYLHRLIYIFGNRTLDAFEYIGFEQFKQWGDPSHGYTVSLKYGAPIYGITLPMVVTSNYTPQQLMRPDQRYPVTELEALERRFDIIHIKTLLEREGLGLQPKEVLKDLKKNRNADFSKCFINLDEEAKELEIDRQTQQMLDERRGVN